jgi:hypothetical protein
MTLEIAEWVDSGDPMKWLKVVGLTAWRSTGRRLEPVSTPARLLQLLGRLIN